MVAVVGCRHFACALPTSLLKIPEQSTKCLVSQSATHEDYGQPCHVEPKELAL